MATIDVERPAPAAPLPPSDPNVVIPERVKAAAALAESFYKPPADAEAQPPATTPPAEAPPAETPPAEQPDAAAAEAERARLAEQAASEQQQQPTRKKREKLSLPNPPAAQTPPKADVDDNDESWRKRFYSMEGRYRQSQQTIGSMQEQMTQLGDELVRTQALLAQVQRGQSTPQQPQTQKNSLVTPQDVEAYGPDLIDLARRVAQDAVTPEIEQLRQQNQRLSQRVAQEAQLTVTQILDRDVPEWRQINRDPRFIQWLRLRDVYSGAVRKQLLNAAFQAANAPRVKAFFEGFIADEAVAGNEDHQAPQVQQPVTPPAPREPAVRLDTITAPGRARPASGNPPSQADKPVFTRTQISKFYADVRRGAYLGRDADKNALEAQIFEAQRDGRVR